MGKNWSKKEKMLLRYMLTISYVCKIGYYKKRKKYEIVKGRKNKNLKKFI